MRVRKMAFLVILILLSMSALTLRMMVKNKPITKFFTFNFRIEGELVDESEVIALLDTLRDPLTVFFDPELIETTLDQCHGVKRVDVNFGFSTVVNVSIESKRPVARALIFDQPVILDSDAEPFISARAQSLELPEYHLIPSDKDQDYLHGGVVLKSAYSVITYLAQNSDIFWNDFHVIDCRNEGELHLYPDNRYCLIRLGMRNPAGSLCDFELFLKNRGKINPSVFDLRFPSYMAMQDLEKAVQNG